MAPRPRLSEESFLQYIFHPSKNPKPTGLRHRTLKGSKSAKKARVNAYNKMPAEKQAVIDRAGLRESFLRGEVTYTDAKKALRGQGVIAGHLKPLRVRRQAISAAQSVYDDAVVDHLKDEGLDQQPHWSEEHVRQRLARTGRHTKRDMLLMPRAELRRKSRLAPSEFEEYDFNPYWYH